MIEGQDSNSVSRINIWDVAAGVLIGNLATALIVWVAFSALIDPR